MGGFRPGAGTRRTRQASVVAPALRRGWTPLLAMREARRAPGGREREAPPGQEQPSTARGGGQFQGGPAPPAALRLPRDGPGSLSRDAPNSETGGERRGRARRGRPARLSTGTPCSTRRMNQAGSPSPREGGSESPSSLSPLPVGNQAGIGLTSSPLERERASDFPALGSCHHPPACVCPLGPLS